MEASRLHVLHVITGLNRGGAEGALFRLVKNDANNRHVVVSLLDHGVYGRPLEALGATVVALGMRRGRLDPRALVRLWSLIRDQRPDVVQTWMYHADLLGGLAARLAGVSSVVWGIRHSNLDPQHNSRSTRAVARLCAGLSWWLPAAIASCSEQAARVHGALGYDARKMAVIANGFELGALAPDPSGRARVRAELGVSDAEVLVGLVARWDPQKDHANLLRALASETLRDETRLRLVLVGPGVDAANTTLGTLVAASGLAPRTALLGARSDIGAIMSALDLHVLPSAHGEAFPNVVAEAMACGTPVVATDVGDAPLIVGDTGWIVAPSDSDALARAIASALSAMRDRAAWAARQRTCRARIVELFPVQRMVERYTDLWRRAATPP